MRHEPYASLDELIAPEALARLSGEPIRSVDCQPFVGGHSASGSGFVALVTNGGSGPRFVVKRSSLACDWIVRATGDTAGREVQVWANGLLDELPQEITHPVLACARDGDGWAILMRDVSDALTPGTDAVCDAPLGAHDHDRHLDAMAALHATFWESPRLSDPALGLCSPWHLYTSLSAETASREAGHPNGVVAEIRGGWALLPTLIDPDLAALLARLAVDPGPLCAALARFPQTLVHGDPRTANIGIEPGPPRRMILLDWHFVGPSVPATDLAWYLDDNGHRLPMPLEESIARYRDRLRERLGPRSAGWDWQAQLDLALLGQLVRCAWGTAWHAVHSENPVIRERLRAQLDWWVAPALAGAARL